MFSKVFIQPKKFMIILAIISIIIILINGLQNYQTLKSSEILVTKSNWKRDHWKFQRENIIAFGTEENTICDLWTGHYWSLIEHSDEFLCFDSPDGYVCHIPFRFDTETIPNLPGFTDEFYYEIFKGSQRWNIRWDFGYTTSYSTDNILDASELDIKYLAKAAYWLHLIWPFPPIYDDHIVKAKITYNTLHYWGTDEEGGIYDIEKVSIHEFGHWVALIDIDDTETVMYKYYRFGSAGYELYPQDIVCINYIY